MYYEKDDITSDNLKFAVVNMDYYDGWDDHKEWPKYRIYNDVLDFNDNENF